MEPHGGEGVAAPEDTGRIEDLAGLLAAAAAAVPERLAFVEGDERLTFGDLAAQAAEVAEGLASRGVAAGERVALCLPAGIGFVRAFFALQRLGAVPFALDPATPPQALAARVARGRPALALVAGEPPGLAAALDAAGVRWRASDPPRRESGVATDLGAGAARAAFLQATSGTSGEPRLAVVSQRAVLASLAAAARFLEVRDDDVLVAWVPPWHDLGLMRFVLGPVAFRVTSHVVPPAIRTLPLWLQTIERAGGTITGAPDFAYRLAVRMAGDRVVDLSTLRVATNGGEPVRRGTVEEFERRFGVPGVVLPGYGLAEATLGVAGVRPGERVVVDERGNVACGRALPGVEMRVLAPAGGAGEILVRGPALFSGYFEAPEATADVLRDGWLHTGDIGRIDAEGRLFVLGRRRALLKRGGVPLPPRELEEVVERLPGVRAAAAVSGRASAETATEPIVLVVEVEPAAMAATAELAAAAAGAVAAALGFTPERVLVVPPRTIPRTRNGKTRYGALREEVLAGRLEAEGLSGPLPQAT